MLTDQVEKSRMPSSVQTSGQPEALQLMSHTQKTELSGAVHPHVSTSQTCTSQTCFCCMVQVVWRGYVQSMLQASFTSDLVLYAASGLLTYGANDGTYISFLSLTYLHSGAASCMLLVHTCCSLLDSHSSSE